MCECVCMYLEQHAAKCMSCVHSPRKPEHANFVSVMVIFHQECVALHDMLAQIPINSVRSVQGMTERFLTKLQLCRISSQARRT